jgi:phenylacetic acid degradation protein
VVRELTDQELEWKESGTMSYQELTRRCLETMRATSPLPAPEADRPRIVLEEIIPLHVFKQRRR